MATANPAIEQEFQEESGLKSYRTPWKGRIVLVCKKCQKKLRQHHKKNRIAQLGKALKKWTRQAEGDLEIHVIQVSCLKVCPKGGVTVCTQEQLRSNECSIVRSRADADRLVQSMKHCVRGNER